MFYFHFFLNNSMWLQWEYGFSSCFFFHFSIYVTFDHQDIYENKVFVQFVYVQVLVMVHRYIAASYIFYSSILLLFFIFSVLSFLLAVVLLANFKWKWLRLRYFTIVAGTSQCCALLWCRCKGAFLVGNGFFLYGLNTFKIATRPIIFEWIVIQEYKQTIRTYNV